MADTPVQPGIRLNDKVVGGLVSGFSFLRRSMLIIVASCMYIK
jgi:hypothetical protein